MGTIQTQEAYHLRKESAGKSCEHPNFTAERYLSDKTGDYVCTECGEVFSPDRMAQVVAARTPPPRRFKVKRVKKP